MYNANTIQLDQVHPGVFANILLLGALFTYVSGTIGLIKFGSRKSEASFALPWLLLGVFIALGLGLFSNCGFHVVTLDYMPWTALAAIVIGGHSSAYHENE
jgi:ABC-type Na+ efflux pump permease subunit